MPDFHRLAKKFHRRVANLEDVIRVFQAVQRVSSDWQDLHPGDTNDQLESGLTLLQAVNANDPANKQLIEDKYIAPLRVS